MFLIPLRVVGERDEDEAPRCPDEWIIFLNWHQNSSHTVIHYLLWQGCVIQLIKGGEVMDRRSADKPKRAFNSLLWPLSTGDVPLLPNSRPSLCLSSAVLSASCRRCQRSSCCTQNPGVSFTFSFFFNFFLETRERGAASPVICTAVSSLQLESTEDRCARVCVRVRNSRVATRRHQSAFQRVYITTFSPSLLLILCFEHQHESSAPA